MNPSNPQRTHVRWPGRRSRPTSTRTGGRTRPVVAVILLILLALIGGFSVLFVYGFQETYSDPILSDLEGLGEMTHGLVIATVVLIGVAALAVGIAREGTRRLVGIAAGVLVGACLLGLVLANHYGLGARKVLSAAPPGCGIANTSLNQEFRNIDHPGFFDHPGDVSGGSTSRTDCTLLLRTRDIASALAAYDERLTMMGYQVTRARTGLTATRDGFKFCNGRGPVHWRERASRVHSDGRATGRRHPLPRRPLHDSHPPRHALTDPSPAGRRAGLSPGQHGSRYRRRDWGSRRVRRRGHLIACLIHCTRSGGGAAFLAASAGPRRAHRHRHVRCPGPLPAC